MKILHLEDQPRDAALVADMLNAKWDGCVIDVVSDRAGFLAALDRAEHDIILSDFRLPGFSGADALALARERRAGTPFIFLSGTVGEDTAVEIVRAGAADYLLKDRMQRLPLAIERALRDHEERRYHREAEERIREQAELLDKARDGIVVTDLDNHVVYWNRGAERIFGWPAAEVLGQGIAMVFGQTLDPEIAAMYKHLAESDEWRGELSTLNRQREALVVDARVTLIRDAAGRPKSRLTIVTDITEKKKLEQQFFRAQRMECLGMLSAGIAHDLNNALSPMLMAGQLLRTHATDPGDLQLLDILDSSAKRGASLVKQIVSFASGAKRESVLVQTRHLLRDIADLMQQTFPKTIRFTHEMPVGLWVVRGNPTQLHQVLLNLCINARDAMPQGGTLQLRARNEALGQEAARAIPDATPGNFLVIEVADTGTGIPPEIRERIWEPFFTTKAEDKGTGLGLSTVRGIVASHGGFVAMESELGRGTTFRVFLPAVVEQAPETRPADSVAPFAPAGKGELIFLVDDDAGSRESANALLLKHGYRPMATGDAMEAIAEFSARMGEVALVITDLDMPRLAGVALAEAIRRLNPAVKILFISGTDDGTGPKQAGAIPGAAFLAKPLKPGALLATVDALLKNRA